MTLAFDVRCLHQVRGLSREMGVREGRDERDRRPRHPPLLRLTLPHGTGEKQLHIKAY